MSAYKATVIKSGNSYALRVPKEYVERQGLRRGQKVRIGDVMQETKQDNQAVQTAFRELQKLGAFKEIKDPVAWQREIRKDRPLPGRG